MAEQPDHDAGHLMKRFKHQSYAQSLKNVHLPSTFNQTQYETEIGDNESHFHEALNNWRQLNLAPSFIRFAGKADPLSASMPLLLHNWREIIDMWIAEVATSDDEGLRPLLDLLQKMAHDLRTTLSPAYPELLEMLLNLLPRSLPAPVLTILLETFSSLFRFLLIVSVNPDLLVHTWSLIRVVLPKCNPDVQRAMADVWGSTLRRMKSTARERAITLLLEEAEGIENATTWVIVFACKSISQTLHTSTASIFKSTLDLHISTESSDRIYTIIRRSITALIHHVNNATQFSILGDLLVERMNKLSKSTDPSSPEDLEQLRRILEIVTIPCEVRKGSRLTENQQALLIAELNTLPIVVPTLNNAILKFTVALLTSTDMALWLGPGLKFLQRSWSVIDDSHAILFVLNLNGCLAELGWGGWKLVALPLLLKSIFKPELLKREPRKVLSLLATLKREKRLNAGDIDSVWKARNEQFLLERLKVWSGDSLELIAELNDILALSSFCTPAITSMLIQIIQRILDCRINMERDFLRDQAWVLGASMHALSKREVSEWSHAVDLNEWTRKCTKTWYWSAGVLEGLVTLGQVCSTEVKPVSFFEVYGNLKDSFLSHSRPLRLNALRLLSSKLVNIDDGPSEVLKRCLQGEEVPLDVQGVRERVLRIGRVGQVVGDEGGADLCGRWLIAQLKVNLRPLWSPSATALNSLGQRYGNAVWTLLFSELQALGGEVTSETPSHWTERTKDLDGDMNEDTWEEERSWRDPSAQKIRKVVLQWQDPECIQKIFLKGVPLQERFDKTSYGYQLLLTLGECSTIAEKHNRDLVPEFLALAGQDATSKLPRQKLVAWLSLFSKFSNPKAAYKSEDLRDLYIHLLSHPDKSLQNLALSCLLTYKSPHLLSHEDKLKAILDDTKWRDELVSLEIDAIQSQSRPEVVDCMIRLMFGSMLEKRRKGGGADRRSAVLSTLSGCTNDELGLLIDLMMRPLGWNRHSRAETPFTAMALHDGVSHKHVAGFLTLLGDVLKNLGSRLVMYWPVLLGMTIDILNDAQNRIDQLAPGDEAIQDDDILSEEDELDVGTTRAVRSLRQLGLKRFADFFRSVASFDFSPYVSVAFSFISPRLPKFSTENTQAPSALLDLFYTWSLDEEHVQFFVNFDNNTLPSIYNCCTATNVKPVVTLRIFDIIDRLLAYSSTDDRIRETVLKPHVSLLLSNLTDLAHKSKGVTSITSPVQQRQITILSELAQFCTDERQASMLISLYTPLLRKPAKFVPEKVKVDLVKTIGKLFPLLPDLNSRSSETYTKTYFLVSQLFQSLRSRQARLSLVSTFHALAIIDTSLTHVAELVESLNAFSKKRIDEPDFDTRLNAFRLLNENLYKTLSASDWLPILYNTLHFIQDPEELSIRNNASYAMRRFIDIIASRSSLECEDIFLKIHYPGLKNGLRSKNEMVRAEVLGVIAYSVQKCSHLAPMQEMQVLLEGGDEEADFFNNILHLQTHRRSRALRRLADHCDEKHLRSSTLTDIFVPLVSNYITSTSSVDHHLVNEAILTTGRMANILSWGSYYALVQKYLKLSRAKDESERVYIRTLVALLENFHFQMDEVVGENDNGLGTILDDTEDVGEGDTLDDTALPHVNHHTATNTTKIADAVDTRLLPNLLTHLEKHDENTDDHARIPIAAGIITVAKHLPAAIREPQISRLLTILSQILRSKSQETRDLTRDAINKIAISLGPEYLPQIFRELRAALLRGPQLHVLAYVTHSLLVHVTSGSDAEMFEILDDCVNDITYISAEVIFGRSGKDVQSEDFKTKMREVRSASSKGLDSFNIAAKFITPVKISSLLVPLRAIMHETESTKVMQQVDDLLARIASGLNSNKHLIPTELLVLCHTLITQNAKFLKQVPALRKTITKSDAIVETKRQVKSETDHYANNSFRFVAFGLDLFNTALRRNRFDFHDSNVMARLESMVVTVGNTLYSTSTPVLLLGLKCVAGLVKCPLKSINKSLPVFVNQILNITRQIGNTEAEIVQVSFKTLATILREGPPVQVKEKDLIYLLELLMPDLEEPSRQASVFAMLRAIVSRKFVIPEIYDMMDKVSEIMVTSQSTQVQELCRGVLLQFLLDYPQGKGRLRKHMEFLAKNLSYVYESGRVSVMELLGAVIRKFETGLIQEYADLIFVALVMSVANDDSARCREMAGLLIKTLYTRLDNEQQKIVMSHLHSWASQQDNVQLTWVSSQVYGFIVDEAQAEALPFVPVILADLQAAISRSAKATSGSGEDEETSMDVDTAWQVPYYAMICLSKILRVYPDLATQDEKLSWDLIVAHLLYPHAWVRTTSCRLLGTLFTAVPAATPKTDLPEAHPLSEAGMYAVARMLCQQLKSEHLDESLGLQVTKNLFYLGKCFNLVAPDKSAIEAEAEDMLDNEATKLIPTEQKTPSSNSLPWLFSKLSYQIKSAYIARRSKSIAKDNWAQQPLVALRWFAAMTSHMEASRLEQFLVHILTPVYRIIEDDVIRDNHMEELKNTAVELQDLVQAKVGPTKFSSVYNQIRQSVLGVRRERKAAKFIQISTNPEAAAKRKQQRNINKKDSKKRKDRGFLDRLGRTFKRRREE